MTGTRLGPYRLEEELGSGGMGSVYAAEVLEEVPQVEGAGRVAVKVVHPHLLEARGFFKRFLKEAEIGRSVRHPSVVRTFDVDAAMVDGKTVHYMVMEFVEGRTLRDLLAELGTVPETLLREIARQVASGLEAIHGAGIVHRDLKPENVLITPDHDVKVMDLGVARLMEESVALTRQGQFAGSLLYAAPEQFGGREVGPSADLYSVGVMLYELASAFNPFQHDGAAAVMKAHLSEVPQRLSDRNHEVSPFLSEIVGTLLKKDPEERFPSSKVLLGLLEEGEHSTWWGEREKVLLKEEGHLPRIPVRRETKLHGRESHLSLLRDAWEAARGGKGAMVLLEGEAGIGKSRLVDAFLDDLKGVSAHVLYGSYPPSGGMGGLTDALVGKFGARGMAEALEPYLTVTTRLIPAFAAQVQHEAAPEGSETLSKEGFHAVFVHLMKALAEERPVLWIVEDLHCAPPDSRAVVLSLARALEGHRVLLVGTTRPGVPEDEMANFSRLPTFRRAEVGRLGAREVMELLKDAFRSSALAERLGGKIALKSDGVPFFVFEMIRGLKEGRFIRQTPDGTYVETQIISEIEVPSAVRDLIEGRLKGIADEDRDLLDVAAVQGVEFDPDLVARVCGIRPMKVLQRFAAMERQSGVVRGSGETCRFDQNQIQEVLYGGLMGRLQKEYHAALAEAFAEREGLESTDPEEVPGEAALFLATHHLRGSRPRAVLPFLENALRHLAKADRSEALLLLSEKALGAPGLLAGAPRVRVLLERAERLTMLGQVPATEAALHEAKGIAEGLGDPALSARVLAAEGSHEHALSRHPEARALLGEAADLAARTGQEALEANARNVQGLAALAMGDEEAAVAAFEETLVIARRTGDRAREGGTTNNLANVSLRRGRRDEAEQGYRAALALVREAGHARFEVNIRSNLAEFIHARGDLGTFLVEMRGVLRTQRELGNRRSEVNCRFSLAAALALCGRFEEASALLEGVTALAREGGHHDWELESEARVAHLLVAKGEAEAAAGRLRAALASARESGLLWLERLLLQGLGSALAEAGKVEEARKVLEEAAASPAGEEEEDRTALALLRAELRGDPGAALEALRAIEAETGMPNRMQARWKVWRMTGDRPHLEEAWRMLRHLRDHAPEEYRGSLMEKVPLHRDIAAAAGEAGLGG